MADLENAVMRAVRHNRSVLVCDADADRLQAIVQPLAAPRPVVLTDYRARIPANLMEDLEGKLREDQIVHVAIGPRLDYRLLETLWTLRGRESTLKGVIILSTSASSTGELPFKNTDELRDLFSDVVGSGGDKARWIPPQFHQAVVLVHGIGEQRPGATLMSFADAVLPKPDPEAKGRKYSSEHDGVSFDYRKLRANRREELQNHKGLDASILTPRNTDFFEYYWAPKVEETIWRHVVRWLWLLLSRKPKTHLFAVWAISWLLLAVGVVAAIMGVVAWFTSLFAAVPLFALSIASWVGLGVLETIVIGFLGDAARYFDDHPSNDKIRTEIRRGGVEQLRNLIRSGNYDRIVVVGHSLGSVIAYDVLKHLWETEFWKEYDIGVADRRQTALDEYEAAANELGPEPDDKEIVRYQEKQNLLLRELRAFGNPWPVTDLITLASPLAHAPYLVPDFGNRRSDGELPGNPPNVFEPKLGSTSFGKSFAVRAGPDLVKGEFQPRIPLRNGLFTVTRWTNLYFPTRLGLFGDFVSGPLQPHFGNGIRDLKVTGSLLRRLTLLAHVSYWHAGASRCAVADNTVALDVLVDTLDLNGERLGIPRFEQSHIILSGKPLAEG